MSAQQEANSEATARAILDHYAQSAVAEAAVSIEAILLIGSLATSSCVAGPGDIDQITLLRRSAPPRMQEQLGRIASDAMDKFGRAVHLSPVA